MKKGIYILISFSIIVTMALILSMCGGGGGVTPTPPSPPSNIIDLPPGTNDVDLGGGKTLTIDSPVSVTVNKKPDPSSYPPGSKITPIQLTGTLGPGETATITFKDPNGFDLNDQVAYVDASGQWAAVLSILSPDGKSISATVDHFSIWSVMAGSVSNTKVTVKFTIPDAVDPDTDYYFIIYDDDSYERVFYDIFEEGDSRDTEHTLDGIVPPGTYYIGAWVDVDGNFGEPDDHDYIGYFESDDGSEPDIPNAEVIEDGDHTFTIEDVFLLPGVEITYPDPSGQTTVSVDFMAEGVYWDSDRVEYWATVDRIEVSIDSGYIGDAVLDTNAWQYDIDISNLANGKHELKVEAYSNLDPDSIGEYAVDFTVNTITPGVNIIVPTNGQIVSADFTAYGGYWGNVNDIKVKVNGSEVTGVVTNQDTWECEIDISNLEDGGHELKVEAYYDTEQLASDMVKFYVAIQSSGPDSFEPDNTYNDANVIGIGEDQSHTIHTTMNGGDEDWMFFEADEGFTYTLETKSAGTGFDFDTVLSLYDTDGTTLLTSDDDSGQGSYSMISDWECPGDENYYIRVAGNNQELGDYNIEVTKTGTQQYTLGGTITYGGTKATIGDNSPLMVGVWDMNNPDADISGIMITEEDSPGSGTYSYSLDLDPSQYLVHTFIDMDYDPDDPEYEIDLTEGDIYVIYQDDYYMGMGWSFDLVDLTTGDKEDVDINLTDEYEFGFFEEFDDAPDGWIPSDGRWTVSGGLYLMEGVYTASNPLPPEDEPAWSFYNKIDITDFTFSVQLEQIQGDFDGEDGGDWGILFRFNLSTASGYALWVDNDGSWGVDSLAGETEVNIHEEKTFTPGGTVTVECLGNTLNVYTNGELMFGPYDLTQSSPVYTQGQVGLYGWDDSEEAEANVYMFDDAWLMYHNLP